ncbi:MAG: geranylgeranylglycerol-phosphate geranylgeranyltransferase [Candidatus Promineifilaceae bacterium]
MKAKLVALLKLTRPMNAFSGALAVILGGYVAGTGAWDRVALAAAATALITGAANAWNDYLDIDTDRINQPQRVLPAGMISPAAAVNLSLGLTALGLILAALVGPATFLIAAAASLLLYLYSWKLKSSVLLGNAVVALTSAMSAVFGGVAAGNARPTFWLALIILTAIMGREVLKTLADYEGDLRQRVRTIATTWGRRPARMAFYGFTAATVWVMMLPYLLKVYQPIYAYVVAFGVYPMILYALTKVHRNASSRQLERVSQLMKLDFLVWFVAVLLGAAG